MNMIKVDCHLPEVIDNKVNNHLKELIYTPDTGRNLVLGKKPTSTDTQVHSNDYLALSNHPEIIDAQISSLLARKDTPFMSNVFLQDDGVDKSVERKLAEYIGFQNCVVAPSGWIANIGLLQTICNSDTTVYIDFFAHMSLWEGARIAGANVHPFMHNNSRHLKRLIKRNGPGVILVDSIYSTLGTVAPLVEIVEIAKEFNCVTVVDESHSLGVLGQQGSGLVGALGLTSEVDFITASLAKTFAYRAGAVWCNNSTGSVMPYVSFPSIFSSAMMAFELDRIDATLTVIKNSSNSRERLLEVSKKVRSELLKLGFNIRSESQIIGLETGDKLNTRKVRDHFDSNGVVGSVFCTPATPENKNILRLSLNSALTDDDVDRIISVSRSAINNPDLYFL